MTAVTAPYGYSPPAGSAPALGAASAFLARAATTIGTTAAAIAGTTAAAATATAALVGGITFVPSSVFSRTNHEMVRENVQLMSDLIRDPKALNSAGVQTFLGRQRGDVMQIAELLKQRDAGTKTAPNGQYIGDALTNAWTKLEQNFTSMPLEDRQIFNYNIKSQMQQAMRAPEAATEPVVTAPPVAAPVQVAAVAPLARVEGGTDANLTDYARVPSPEAVAPVTPFVATPPQVTLEQPAAPVAIVPPAITSVAAPLPLEIPEPPAVLAAPAAPVIPAMSPPVPPAIASVVAAPPPIVIPNPPAALAVPAAPVVPAVPTIAVPMPQAPATPLARIEGGDDSTLTAYARKPSATDISVESEQLLAEQQKAKAAGAGAPSVLASTLSIRLPSSTFSLTQPTSPAAALVTPATATPAQLSGTTLVTPGVTPVTVATPVANSLQVGGTPTVAPSVAPAPVVSPGTPKGQNLPLDTPDNAEGGNSVDTQNSSVGAKNNRVLFGTDSREIDQTARQTLHRMAGDIQKAVTQAGGSKKIVVQIDAGASRTGSDAHNQRLSQARGESTRDGLIKELKDAGVDPNKVEFRIQAHGRDYKFLKVRSEGEEVENRQATIKIDGPKESATPAAAARGGGPQIKETDKPANTRVAAIPPLRAGSPSPDT